MVDDKLISPHSSKGLCFLSVATLLAVMSAPWAFAKQEVVRTRGFDPAKTYATGEIDSIDTMSGNLTIRVPLGLDYGSNGTLAYSFSLAYNSNIWDHQYIESGGTIRQVPLEYDEISQSWDFINDGDLDPHVHGTEAFPSPQWNAGLGWIITLGELKDGYTYVAEDGSEHKFYAKLHGDVPSGNDPFTASGPFYTRDGTFLRMTRVSETERLVEFPNGVQKRFVCDAGCNARPYSRWHLSEMADPFGNLLYVERGSPNGSGEFTVTYRQVTAAAGGPGAYYARPAHATTPVRTHTFVYRQRHPHEVRLVSATLAAPGGEALYTFSYEDRFLYRERGSTWAGPGLRVPFDAATNKVAISTLSSIALPAGGGTWAFDYKKIAPSSPDADLSPITWGSMTYYTSSLDGRLRSVNLPTGGRVEYDYAPRAIPARKCWAKAAEGGALGTLGISQRRTYDRGSTSPDGVWRYYTSRYRSTTAPAAQCNFFKELVSTVVAPDGAATVTYYTVYKDSLNYNDGQPWNPAEYGLPMTKAVNDSADGVATAQSRFLSTQVYQCSSPAVFESNRDDALRRLLAHRRSGTEPATCGQPVRSTFVRYEHSAFDCDGEIAGECRTAFRRVASEKTLFHGNGTAADPDTFVTTDFSDYDGLGHYRLTTHGGNLYKTVFEELPGSDSSSFQQNYNPGVTYNAASATVEPVPSRWLLELYDRTVRRERPNGDASRPENHATTEFLFDADTGFLLRTRVWGGTAAAGRTSADLLTVSVRSVVDAETVKITDSHYGGDDQNTLSTTQNLDALTRPSQPEYVIEQQRRHGAPLLTRYVKCDGSATAYTVEDNVVHAPSGLVTSSKDDAGLVTAYGYDSLGRPSSLKVPGETAWSYTYSAATAGAPAKATATRGSGNDATTTVVSYDGFGRPAVTEARVPDDANGNRCSNCWNQQKTGYDAMGRKSFESVVAARGSDHVDNKKRWFKYETLGRLASLQEVDGSKRTFSYYGLWHVRKTIPNLGAIDHYFDRHGRLVKVTEGSGPAFRYEYDSSNRLRAVYRAPNTLRNSFFHDNRGFLTSETSPEIKGAVKYTYDARGNVLSRSYNSAAAMYDLKFLYDEAERLVDVKRGSTPLKHFDYVPIGTLGSGGKLAAAKRYSTLRRPGPVVQYDDYEVTEALEYHPSTGRVAAANTSVSLKTLNGSTGVFSARQEYTYDPFGRTATVRYPHGCAPASPCGRLVTLGYRNGALTSMSGFIADAYYHPNGLYRKLVRTNGTQDELKLSDADPTARAHSIGFYKSGNSQAFGLLGPIVYNGAGKITRIGRLAGSDSYGYDDLGRLDTASVRGQSQTVQYDAYGNIDKITTGGVAYDLATDDATNRLTAAVYDDAGFILSVPDKRDASSPSRAYSFTWDALGNLSSVTGHNLRRTFLYDAHDERVAMFDYAVSDPAVTQMFTVRDLEDRVLSEFLKVGDQPLRRTRDYVFRGGSVAAAVDVAANGSESVRHFHNDHLGTPRVITNGSAMAVLRRDYLPFGQELLETTAQGRLEFTGHERDDDGTLSAEGDLDYMHARHYSPWLGRFLSVDPVHTGVPESTQTWNRYAYALNDPVNFLDPTGLTGEAAGGDAAERKKAVKENGEQVLGENDEHLILIGPDGSHYLFNPITHQKIQMEFVESDGLADWAHRLLGWAEKVGVTANLANFLPGEFSDEEKADLQVTLKPAAVAEYIRKTQLGEAEANRIATGDHVDRSSANYWQGKAAGEVTNWVIQAWMGRGVLLKAAPIIGPLLRKLPK